MRLPRPLTAFVRDSEFRTAVCLWVIVAGICVLLANAVAASFS